MLLENSVKFNIELNTKTKSGKTGYQLAKDSWWWLEFTLNNVCRLQMQVLPRIYANGTTLDLRGGMLDNLMTFQVSSFLLSILLHKLNFAVTMHIFDLFVWSANRMVNAG